VYLLEFAGEDDPFAVAEARVAAGGVEAVAPGVGLARTLDRERARTLAYTRHASELLGRCEGGVDAAVRLLEAAGIDRGGMVAVRAEDARGSAGADTRSAERVLGTALVERGFEIDLETPDHELRAVFADGECFLGWWLASSVRDFATRKPTDRPFFQPGSMDPLLARALVNLAGVAPGDALLDPMCGTGGVLIEAGLVGARPLGLDAQAKMVRGTRRNLAASLDERDDFAVVRGDAARLPFRDGAAAAAVFDAPYGRQSKIEGASVRSLVGDALAECRRVAARAVVVGDRSWAGAARRAGWTVEDAFRRRVHRSLTRHVLVLE
jgi:tRNA (guanine10-N2)-dimethyltransferase